MFILRIRFVESLLVLGALFTAMSCKPKDADSKLKGIAVEPQVLELFAGESAILKCTPIPASAQLPYLYWESQNPHIADVDEFGNVTAGTVEGETQINVSTMDGLFNAVCKVVVSASMEIRPKALWMEVGKTESLQPVFIPAETSRDVVWRSGNTDVAKVDEKGTVTAIALGETVVTATTTDGKKMKAACNVTVSERVALESISIKPQSIPLDNSAPAFVQVTLSPENTTCRDIKFSSSDHAILIAEGTTGQLVPFRIGVSTITATSADGSVTASCDYAVVDGSYCKLTSTSEKYSLSVSIAYWCWADLNDNGIVDTGERFSSSQTTSGRSIPAGTVKIYGPVSTLHCPFMGDAIIDISHYLKSTSIVTMGNTSLKIIADKQETYQFLTKLTCYTCNISGEAATEFVNSLPKVPSGDLFFCRVEDNGGTVSVKPDETNKMTPADVKIAESKGWKVKNSDSSDYKPVAE